MELNFSIDEHPSVQRQPREAVARWLRSFASHDPNVAFKPSPFAVVIRSDKGEFVKGIPAENRDEANDLIERLQAECGFVGVHAFLVRHSAPDRFVKRAVHPS